MSLKITHTEFAKATPEAIWKLWSNVASWSQWDHGIEWCKLKNGHKFQLHGEGSLLPKGAPAAVDIKIIECTPNKSFTDEGKFQLGTIHFTHEVIPHNDGVKVTHTLQFNPANPGAKEIFSKQMFPKLQKELPESVKTLAKLAEQQNQSKGSSCCHNHNSCH